MVEATLQHTLAFCSITSKMVTFQAPEFWVVTVTFLMVALVTSVRDFLDQVLENQMSSRDFLQGLIFLTIPPL